MTKFEELKGKIIQSIELTKDDPNTEDQLIFTVSDNEKYKMYHAQDCCENVNIEDICGELDWLIGEPILVAEERISDETDKEDGDVEVWTFYEMATIKGSVTIRWHGSSNGYYSMSADFERI